MDFIAEIVLGYVDDLVDKEIKNDSPRDDPDFKILRYRDDYRIFANSDECAEQILKIVSDKLRSVGMKLGLAKTKLMTNVVEGSIKPDKLAGIELQDLGETNAKTIQKQLLRYQHIDRIGVSFMHSVVNGRPPVFILRSRVGAGFDQCLDRVDMPLECGELQGSSPILVFRFGISAGLDQ